VVERNHTRPIHKPTTLVENSGTRNKKGDADDNLYRNPSSQKLQSVIKEKRMSQANKDDGEITPTNSKVSKKGSKFSTMRNGAGLDTVSNPL